MKKQPYFCLLVLLFTHQVILAQDKWDLRRAVEYALINNISVKQEDVQARLTALQLKQSKLSQYPSANLSGNVGYSSGRNQNPVTFDLITQGYLFSNYSLQTGIDIFNWYSKKNSIAANEFETKAAFANIEKLRNDIALNVAGAYLQTLLALEQINVSEIQVEQTKAQLQNTRKLA
jgi:outer membrane protein